jgi:hypothetical protein
MAKEYMHATMGAQHELWLCLPTKKCEQKYEYVNLSHLCKMIEEEAAEFKQVQSPVMTYIFLLTLSGTDFFEKICNGIGFKTKWEMDEEKREKQCPGIFDTFMDNISMFSHLVQFYTGEHSLQRQKRIVIDEKLFIVFLQYCYMAKYGKVAKKKQKTENVTFEMVQAHCSKLKNDKKPPSEDVMLRICRQLDWNLDYILNAWKNIHIDPFEVYEGKPYYGYVKEPKMTIVDIVATKQKPVDETCKKHFLKRREKEEIVVDIPQKRKYAALDKIKGLF